MRHTFSYRTLLAIAVVTILSVVSLTVLGTNAAFAATSSDWTTYGHDAQRSNYNGAETTLNASNVPNLKLKWQQFAANGVSVQPIESNNVVYWGSWDGYEHAFTTAGVHIWDTLIGTTTDSGCNPPAVGVASTATLGSIGTTPTIFVGGGNATFYALNAATGAVSWSTSLGSSPSHFIWDSPLVANGSVYIGVSSFGDCPLVQGQLLKLNATTGVIQATFNVVPNGCTGGGVWGSPTLGTSGLTLFITTGNNGPCGSAEPYTSAIVKLNTADLSVSSSWQVPASQLTGDGDFGTTPTILNVVSGGTTNNYVGAANKNGLYYMFNRTNLATGPVWQTRVAVDASDCPQCGDGSIAPSAWDGTTLYAGGGNTTINGVACKGSVDAINPLTGAFKWQHCMSSGPVLAAVTVIPGVVFVNQGSWVMGLNAVTGATIFRYNDVTANATFYGADTVANGMLYAANLDGNLYAFGL